MQKKTMENRSMDSPVLIIRENKVTPSKKLVTETLEWAERKVNSLDKVKVAKAIAWFVNPTIYITFSGIYFFIVPLM